MLTIFESIIIGHLIGDYLLQPKKMAIKKSQPGFKGFIYCLVHCLIYTISICITTSTTKPLLIILIFISHFPIDRWSLASWWLKLIKGRNFNASNEEKEAGYEIISLSFSAVVYTITDNTMHLILLIIFFNL